MVVRDRLGGQCNSGSPLGRLVTLGTSAFTRGRALLTPNVTSAPPEGLDAKIGSNESDEILEIAFLHLLVKAGDHVFLEVRGIAVRGQRLVIAILLIDQHRVRIFLHLVRKKAE